MSDLAIVAQGLSKQYLIGGAQKTYNKLSDQIADMLYSPVRRMSNLIRGNRMAASELSETIWALRDVSFEVQHGEVTGIIGRNGAGKSTLLKILSRITEPTDGFVDIYGRVGSLLEVGTGFHPELTGSENVYLNGAILGMSRSEIDRKFDEIVEFAEIGKFMNTPVKHYSSGMYVRLAFSVAAHLDPEILLVDEVLAVGDTSFQKKCLGKMDNVAKRGRTVLFVSHNMGLIQNLCQHGILLRQGEITSRGQIEHVVRDYLQTLEEISAQNVKDRTDREGRGLVRLVDLRIDDGGDPPSQTLRSGGPARFYFELSGSLSNLTCGFTILDEFGKKVTTFNSNVPGPEDVSYPNTVMGYVCEIDELLLLPGRYRVNVFVFGGYERQDTIESAAVFDVEGGLLRGRPVTRGQKDLQVSSVMPHRWRIPVVKE